MPDSGSIATAIYSILMKWMLRYHVILALVLDA